MVFKNLFSKTIILGGLLSLFLLPVLAEEGVEFTVENKELQHGSTGTLEIYVSNYRDESETVGISVPHRDDCEYFQVRDGVESSQFTSTTTFQIDPSEEQVIDLRASVPESSELEETQELVCSLSVSSETNGVQDLQTVVELEQGYTAGISNTVDNYLGTGGWLKQQHTIIDTCNGSEKECSSLEKLELTGLHIFLITIIVSLAFYWMFIRR